MTHLVFQAVRDYSDGVFTVANVFQIGAALAVGIHFGFAATLAFWSEN